MKLLKLLSFKNNAWGMLFSALLIFTLPANATNKVGINTGTQQILNCPINQYAVGMRAVHNDKIIMRIKVRCAGIDSNTGAATSAQTWTAESTSNRPAGASGLRTSNVRCPSGQLLAKSVQGYIGTLIRNGRTPAPAISGLVGKCKRFVNPNRIILMGQENNKVARKNHILRNNNEVRVGAEYRGSGRMAGNPYNMKDKNQSALSGLRVYSSYALNSFWVIEKPMPWAENRRRFAR